jgi:hypothetical protein
MTGIRSQELHLLVAFGGSLRHAAWEILRPAAIEDRPGRCWPSNIGVVALDAMLAVALPGDRRRRRLCRGRGWGLCVALDCPIINRGASSCSIRHLPAGRPHAVPTLAAAPGNTRTQFDVTTGIRFHPIEILLSMGIKLGVVAALGVPAVAVLVFEVLLNATSMFNHANVHIPKT